MKNITYLLGAGASAQCLPLINGIEKGMAEMLILFEDSKELHLSDSDYFESCKEKTKREVQIDFLNNLKWVMHECRNHASIDTYAKKLFIRNDRKLLKKLKVTLSVYLVFEQCRKNYDKRYDTFFASILSDSYSSFPGNIKIITWNYDYQIERAYAEYTQDYRVESAEAMLHIQNRAWGYSNISKDEFGVCKLNGTVNIHSRDFYNFQYVAELNSPLGKNSIETALNNYSLLLYTKGHGCKPSLSFAWENENEDEDGHSIITRTKALTKETDILVVIGYSFPFFNRLIDKQIIGNMSKLEKVYFQAPDANNLAKRFNAIRTDIPANNLTPRFDTDQFLLPNEL